MITESVILKIYNVATNFYIGISNVETVDVGSGYQRLTCT
jgi:hypothetical protein